MSNDASMPPPSPPPAQDESKPWWKRWWGIALITLGVLAVIGGFLGDPEDETDSETTTADASVEESVSESPTSKPEEEPEPEPESTTDEPSPEAEPSPEPEPSPSPTPAGPEPAFGDGTFAVGEDVQPGIYRSDADSTICYWARLAGFGGDLDDIIANGNSSPYIVAIDDSDEGFEAQGCGDWFAVADTYPDGPATEFGDGVYEVGAHIEPGRYRADGSAEDLCYWARLSGFGGTLESIISNGNSPTIVEIGPDDAGFEAFGCGQWTRGG